MSKREDIREGIRRELGNVSGLTEAKLERATDVVFAVLRDPNLDMIYAAEPAMKEVERLISLASVRVGSPGIAWPHGDPPLVHAFRAMIDEAAK